jgi:ankyrin repeat protein
MNAFVRCRRFGLVLACLLLSTSCGDDKETARSQLTKLDLQFSKVAFIGAVENSDEVAVDLFLRSGMDPDTRDLRGRPTIHRAAAFGHRAIVERILAAGGEVDGRTVDGETALMVAAFGGHDATVQLLLEDGARVDAETKRGVTPLISAVLGGREDIVSDLVRRGADVDKHAGHLLLLALESKVPALTSRFASRRALADDSGGQSALHSIAETGKFTDELRRILEIIPNVQLNVRNDAGETPLMLAVKNRQAACTKVLIGAGASVSIKDEVGFTVLDHCVSLWGYGRGSGELLCDLLFSAGARPTISTFELIFEQEARVRGGMGKTLDELLDSLSANSPETLDKETEFLTRIIGHFDGRQLEMLLNKVSAKQGAGLGSARPWRIGRLENLIASKIGG